MPKLINKFEEYSDLMQYRLRNFLNEKVNDTDDSESVETENSVNEVI